MIPKFIHQIWIQGNELLPEDLKKNKDTIKNMHADWTYILWDEIMILELLKNTDLNLLNKYYKFDYLHQKVDFAKLIILYLYGGICIDMDAYTKKNLDSLFNKYSNYDFVLSNLKDLGYIGNLYICNRLNQCFNNGIFFGKPKSDILNYIIDNITTECSSIDNKIECIHKTTGPRYFNKIINKYLKNINNPNKSNIIILDYKYLEPCTQNICDITENTYIVHKHTGTWINKYIYYLANIYINYIKVINFIVISIIILIILFIFSKILKYC